MKIFTTHGFTLEIYFGSVPFDEIKELVEVSPKESVSVIAGRTPKDYPKESMGPRDPVRSKWHKVKIKVPLGKSNGSYIYYTSVRLDAKDISSLGLTPIEVQKKKEIKFKMMEKLKGH